MRISPPLITVVFPLALLGGGVRAAQGPARPTAANDLRIVVIAGEDAVNIVQQKTAVAPIVEVRDRNDVPVAGAVVRFAIQGGKSASFAGGAPTLTVATNAAGQAVASGFSPLASGAVQINVQAAFQGQVAVATLTQTNVMTAAQAAAVTAGGASGTTTGTSGAAAGGSSGSTAGTSGAAAGAGGGGGLSATTIGLVAGAVAGGVVAVQAVRSEEPQGEEYSGPFAMDWTVGCLVERMTGTLEVGFLAASTAPDAPLSDGNFSVKNGGSSVVSRPANCNILSNGNWGMGDAPLTGTVGNFEAHFQDSVTSQVGGQIQRFYDFRGGLNGGVVTGTFEMRWLGSAQAGGFQTTGVTTVTLSRVQ
jgi:hypothetical protein